MPSNILSNIPTIYPIIYIYIYICILKSSFVATKGLETFRGFVPSKTLYYRTKWPCEPFWPARCHMAFQNDARTLKRGCSSSPRSHQCAPKWHSGLPQSRHGPRKCCPRPLRNHQCTQKCCPGVLQSRQTMQKHGPSLHQGEKN